MEEAEATVHVEVASCPATFISFEDAIFAVRIHERETGTKFCEVIRTRDFGKCDDNCKYNAFKAAVQAHSHLTYNVLPF